MSWCVVVTCRLQVTDGCVWCGARDSESGHGVDVLSSLVGFKLLMDVFGVVPGTVSQGMELMCCPLLQASSY